MKHKHMYVDNKLVALPHFLTLEILTEGSMKKVIVHSTVHYEKRVELSVSYSAEEYTDAEILACKYTTRSVQNRWL